MTRTHFERSSLSRRQAFRLGLAGLGVGAAGTFAPPPFFSGIASAIAQTRANNKILVIAELSGGNDGLNTIVPFGDDAYYRLRPRIGVKAAQTRKIDDYHGFHTNMLGFERLYKDGKLAVVHGCGYENPSFSHFTSMAYWHTGAPNSGETYGWVGRLAEAMDPKGTPNYIVNVDTSQSLAVQSRSHVPLVFDEPERFKRNHYYTERPFFAQTLESKAANPTHAFMSELANTALGAQGLLREAWNNYNSPVDYGISGLALRQVAALIEAQFPTRLYYLAYRNNAFDTHVFQVGVHERLLTYTSDPIAAFMLDMERIGRADDVVLMAFSEFGRRVPENTSLGTDHGTAGPMFVIGKPVKGGQYGKRLDLNDLDDGNVKYTTDFRRVYATMIKSWLGYAKPEDVLRGRFDAFDMFA